jgi:hypothetical protein
MPPASALPGTNQAPGSPVTVIRRRPAQLREHPGVRSTGTVAIPCAGEVEAGERLKLVRPVG